MQSNNDTVISLPDQEITDATGNTWSIVDGQVAVNGAVDPTTANVTEMAYENGVVWQKNSDNLWWSKTSPSAQWSPPYGTSVDPVPGQHASANDTVVIAGATGTIVDGQLNEWTIVNGKVVINGVPDGTTGRVVQLVLSGGQVWQENADGLWWAKSSPTGSWNPPLGTTQAPVPDPKTPTNTVTVELSTLAPIMDASGNEWTVVNGQVALNGVVDQTTRNVSELAYVNGKIWQENADGLWWSKSTPADQWNPPLGTSQSPVPASTRIWNGEDGDFSTAANWTPAGVPVSGQTAIIGAGNAIVGGGAGGGVNFNMQGGSADFRAGAYDIGTLSGSGQVEVSYPQLDTTLTTTGINMLGDDLSVFEFATGGAKYNFVVSGNSDISNGSVLTVAENGTASLPLGTMENDGTMQLSGSTLNVGQLKGTGSIVMTNDATLHAQLSAVSSETIQLESGHIDVGGFSGDHTASMQFLAPVTAFGSDSSILLINTQATQEVFNRTGADAGEMLLYNGSAPVADLHLSGQSQFYASNQPAGGGQPGGVLITAYDTGHSIPVVSHIS
jgi:hypothetical protein